MLSNQVHKNNTFSWTDVYKTINTTKKKTNETGRKKLTIFFRSMIDCKKKKRTKK